jgi:hypothetical protein
MFVERIEFILEVILLSALWKLTVFQLHTKLVKYCPKLLCLLHGHEASDKQNLLKQIYGLPALVAALALMANEEAYRAIQHLELRRGVIAGSLSDLRTEIFDL